MNKRILLKLSGEALAGDGDKRIDFTKVMELAKSIKRISEEGVEIAIVVGGGNFFRGRNSSEMDRVTSDHIGMLATVMNALALNDALLQVGVECRVQTSIEMREIAEFYIRDRAIKHLEKGRVVIFGCGIGSPFFSTDMAAALRASEIKADIILKATNVDCLYTKDPRKYSDFEVIKETSHLRAIKDKLSVMDIPAISLCMENNMPIRIFNINNVDNLERAVFIGDVGSLIK